MSKFMSSEFSLKEATNQQKFLNNLKINQIMVFSMLYFRSMLLLFSREPFICAFAEVSLVNRLQILWLRNSKRMFLLKPSMHSAPFCSRASGLKGYWLEKPFRSNGLALHVFASMFEELFVARYQMSNFPKRFMQAS